MKSLSVLIAAVIAQPDPVPDAGHPIAGRYPEAARILEQAHPIPGLDSGFVPQGITALPDRPIVVLSCYHTSGDRASVLSFVDVETGRLIRTVPLTDAGRPLTGHVGGLTVCRGWIWSASDGSLLRIPVPGDDELNGLTVLDVDARYPVDSGADSLSSDGESLWVGDFSHGRRYRTSVHHHRADQRAWVAVYSVDDSGKLTADVSYEVEGRTVLRPDRVVFVCQQLQGCAVCGDVIALSTSWGRADSRLTFHASPLNSDPIPVPLPEGHATDGYVLDRGNHLYSMSLPAGAEDLEWTGRHLLLPFEGAAEPYRARWGFLGAHIEERFYLLDPETQFAADGDSRMMSVPADRENWIPAGLLLRGGQTLHIRSTGKLTLQKNDLNHYPYVDADGQRGAMRTYAGVRAPNGCLLVKIGETVYQGGTDVTLTADSSGLVALGILENGRYSNNDGQFDVELTVTPD